MYYCTPTDRYRPNRPRRQKKRRSEDNQRLDSSDSFRSLATVGSGVHISLWTLTLGLASLHLVILVAFGAGWHVVTHMCTAVEFGRGDVHGVMGSGKGTALVRRSSYLQRASPADDLRAATYSCFAAHSATLVTYVCFQIKFCSNIISRFVLDTAYLIVPRCYEPVGAQNTLHLKTIHGPARTNSMNQRHAALET